jgi:hypothetical protein
VPLMLRYKSGNLAVKLIAPYLRVRGPADAVPIYPGAVICDDDSGGSNSGSGSRNRGRGSLEDCESSAPGAPAAAQRTSRSGSGDLQLEVGYEFADLTSSGLSMELIGKLKLGTASTRKGLGTGKNAYSLQADFTQEFGPWAALGGAGCRVYERVAGATLRNTPYFSLGAMRSFGDAASVKLVYENRWPVESGAARASELTATLEAELSSSWRMEAYLLKGFSTASANLGTGLLIARRF